MHSSATEQSVTGVVTSHISSSPPAVGASPDVAARASRSPNVAHRRRRPPTHDAAHAPLVLARPIDGAADARGIVAHAVAALQRAAEIAIAAVALVLTSPLMLLVAIIVRVDSPGAALFRQTRVGRGGRLFTFYKFRTLYADARERFPELYAYDAYSPRDIQTLKFKREEDPRITRAGRWLRKSTLDELPNFWNLLKGDIAIVGPRPEIPEMVQHYRPEQLAKFSVRPGITGLAQTHGRGNLAFQDTIAWDLEYVRSQSLWLDIKIVVRTVRMLLTLDGAY